MDIVDGHEEEREGSFVIRVHDVNFGGTRDQCHFVPRVRAVGGIAGITWKQESENLGMGTKVLREGLTYS